MSAFAVGDAPPQAMLNDDGSVRNFSGGSILRAGDAGLVTPNHYAMEGRAAGIPTTADLSTPELMPYLNAAAGETLAPGSALQMLRGRGARESVEASSYYPRGVTVMTDASSTYVFDVGQFGYRYRAAGTTNIAPDVAADTLLFSRYEEEAKWGRFRSLNEGSRILASRAIYEAIAGHDMGEPEIQLSGGQRLFAAGTVVVPYAIASRMGRARGVSGLANLESRSLTVGRAEQPILMQAATSFTDEPVKASLAPYLRSSTVEAGSHVIPPHGNSLKYIGETHVYAVRGPQGTVKIGESMQGVRAIDGASLRGEAQARELTRLTGERYFSEIRRVLPDKRSAREYETRFIETYRRLFGPDSLPGNKSNR